jgi:hypothetical protein
VSEGKAKTAAKTIEDTAKALWKLTKAIAIVSFVLAVICVVIMDVVLGTISLDKIFIHSPSMSLGLFEVHIPLGVMCAGFSMACTAIRMSMWEMMIKGKAQTVFGWFFCSAIAVLNTLIDVAAVPYLLYGESPRELFPTHFDGHYWLIAMIVAVICTTDCYITTKLVTILKYW